MGIAPEEWGREFIKSLTADQRRAFKVELLDLIAAYPGKSGKGLRNAWMRLGAQRWPRSANLRDTIQLWIGLLE